MTGDGGSTKAESRRSFQEEKGFCDFSESEESVTSTKPKEIVIVVESIENIDPCKVKEIAVNIEFAGRVLAQSDQIVLRKSSTYIGLTATIDIQDATPQFLDKILANPVICRVIDYSSQDATIPSPAPSPKGEKEDKRLKTSKSSTSPITINPQNSLGICNMDIGKLLMGNGRIKEILALESEKKQLPQEIITWGKLPKLIVAAILKDEDYISEIMKFNNVIGVTIESVYNAPEYLAEGLLLDAKIPIPNFEDKMNSLVFPNGCVTLLKESDNRKKWLSLTHLEGNGARSKNSILSNASDIINTISEKVNLENEMKRRRCCIQWNQWRQCLLVKSDAKFFFSKITKYRVWPIEIYTASKTNSQKPTKSEKKSKPTTVAPSNPDHFTAFLNLSTLLYPGVTKTRVAAQLFTYSQTDLANKFGAEFPVSVSQISVVTVKSKAVSERSKVSVKEPEAKIVRVTSRSSTHPGASAKEVKQVDHATGSASSHQVDTEAAAPFLQSATSIKTPSPRHGSWENKDQPGVPVVTEEGYPVFIVVEVEMYKPYARKRDPEYLEKQLKNYISLKGKRNKKSLNLELAKKNFSLSLKSIISAIFQEYQIFCSRKKYKNNTEDFGEFHKYLCKQENFSKIKTCLENKTLELINEKYAAPSQRNMPEMYIYLVEEMHRVTNGFMYGLEVESSSDFNVNNLQLYAEEAIEEEEFELAKEFLLMKISICPTNPDYWLDYAIFCIGSYDCETAVEAVREALSLDSDHLMGLLIYGLLMARLQNLSIAEITFQVLLSKYPEFAEGWMVLRLLYLSTNNYEGSDVASRMVSQLEHQRKLDENKKNLKIEEEYSGEDAPPQENILPKGPEYGVGSYVKGKMLTEPFSWTAYFCPPDNINIRTAVLMLRVGFLEYANMALSQELIMMANESSAQYLYYTAVSRYFQGRYGESMAYIETFVKEYGKDCIVWELMGHCYYKLKHDANTIACYEYVIESFNRPEDLHLIYLRMGYYYLKVRKFSCAKKIFLTACKYSPSPKLWKGVGIACLRLDELEEAETAFGEANYLNNRDPETWGYLALTNAALKKLNLFKSCYSEAKKRNLTNEALVAEIESCMAINGLECDD